MMIKTLLFLLISIQTLSATALRGVILLGPESVPLERSGLKSVYGLDVEGVSLPMAPQILDRNIPWEESLDKDLILEIRKTIILAYQKAGRPLVLVEIPPQDLSAGVLQLRVIEGKVGEIISKGNRWYGDPVYKRAIHLREGCPIDEPRLLNDVSILNRNPFHRTEVLFVQGSTEGTTNIELINQDRFPLRAYMGGDNTGTREIDRGRLFSGFDWGCSYGFEQILSYQYCASFNFSKFQSHTFRYFAILPWSHLLSLYGGFATVVPNIPQFKSQGISGQGSLRYEIPLPNLFDHWLQQIQLGFDGKSTNNNLTFVGSGAFFVEKQTANLSQFVLGYQIGWEVLNHKLGLNTLFFYSPGRMLPNEEDFQLQNFRTGASNQYLYAMSGITYVFKLPDRFSFLFQSRFQKSSRPLLASEQIAIGGYDTVRGFDERLYNGDNGVIGNFEFRTPDFPILHVCRDRRIKDRFSAHLFFDCGYADLIQEIIEEPLHAFLSSTGAGIRYGIAEWFTARLDWGFKLHNVPSLGDTSIGKLHVGMILSL